MISKKGSLDGIKKILIFTAFLLYFFTLMVIFWDYSAEIPFKFLIMVVLLDLISFYLSSIAMKGQVVVRNETRNGIDDTEYVVKIQRLLISKRRFYPFKSIRIVYEYENNFFDDRGREGKKIIIESGNNDIDMDLIYPGYGVTAYKIKKVYIYDMFGFFRKKIKIINKNIEVENLPKPQDIDIPVPQNIYVEREDSQLFCEEKNRNDNEQFEIREFKDGDKLNTIHWKLSSKSNELIVREFENKTDTDLYLYIDLDKSLDTEDLLTKSISIAYALVDLQVEFYIWWCVAEKKDGKLVNAWPKRRLIRVYDDIMAAFEEIVSFSVFEKNEITDDILEKFKRENHINYNEAVAEQLKEEEE